MKSIFKNKLFLIFNILIFTHSFGCFFKSDDDMIIGKWELDEINDNGKIRKVKEDSIDLEAGSDIYYMNYFENGHVEGYLFGKQISGNWTFEKRNKKIFIEEEFNDTPIQLNLKEVTKNRISILSKDSGQLLIYTFFKKGN